LALDQETRWRLEDALKRVHVREEAQGLASSWREGNNRLRNGEHRDLMHQQQW
jgi:hypothetical protein